MFVHLVHRPTLWGEAMSDTRSRTGVLVGLAAAVGAFGAAAMMSASTAPTAHADDFTDIINAVDADYAAGQTAFTTALTDFSSDDLGNGLSAFFTGVNDDALSAPNNLLIGTVELLTNESVNGAIPWSLPDVGDLSGAETLAQESFAMGESEFTSAATDFADGLYGLTAFNDLFGVDDAFVVPLEDLLMGSALSF
jgi:hypothetical protein